MTPHVQQDARRYLWRWVTIAAAWALATILVVGWSIIGRHSGPAIDATTMPTLPQPATVTALPTLPAPTFGDPQPTRWPPTSSPPPSATTAAVVPSTEDGLLHVVSIQLGVVQVTATGQRCGQDDLQWWGVDKTPDDSRYAILAAVVCFDPDDAAVFMTPACRIVHRQHGMGACVLYREPTWTIGQYQVATLDKSCEGERGHQIVQACLGRER